MILNKRILTFALPVIFFAQSASAAVYNYNGNSYFLTTQNESWAAAEAEAITDGGHLVSIHTAAENAFVYNSFASMRSPGDALWIGLYDPTPEADGDGGPGSQHAKDFVWSDGSAVDYTNWYPGEPNNAGYEYFGSINWVSQAPTTWNDVNSGSTPYTDPGFSYVDGDGNTVVIIPPSSGVYDSSDSYLGIIEVSGTAVTTTPEPGFYGLMGLGISALSLASVRRRKKGTISK